MKPILLIAFGIAFFISSCQLFSSSKTDPAKPSSHLQSPPLTIERIYIQSFTGQNVSQVQEVFFEIVRAQDVFTFLELLPDNTTGLKIMRLDVTDHSVWETNELLEYDSENTPTAKRLPDQAIRQNAIVSFTVSLYEAETGLLLLRKPYTQPFQQIYTGDEEIKNIPEKREELNRLTEILVYKLLTDFQQAQPGLLTEKLEVGQGYDLISTYVYNLGDGRIKKGIRMAKVGEYDRAIWMWQLVLYEPAEEEPLDIYQLNRASAYFNLGVVYNKLGDRLKAAEMFSMANRMKQKLKYAQAWGNTMQAWLDAQKGSGEQVDKITPSQPKESLILKPAEAQSDTAESERMSDAEILKALERNRQLLLKAQELWPLEPALKAIGPPSPPEAEKLNLFIDESAPEINESEEIQPIEEDPYPEDDLIKLLPE